MTSAGLLHETGRRTLSETADGPSPAHEPMPPLKRRSVATLPTVAAVAEAAAEAVARAVKAAAAAGAAEAMAAGVVAAAVAELAAETESS